MTLSFSLRSAIIASAAILFAWAPSALAAGPLTIEQISPSEILGSWTLAGPSDWTDRGEGATKTIDQVTNGTFTLLVRQPTGATVRLQLLKDSEVVQTADVGQMTFTLAEGESAKVLVFYSFTLVGTVGTASDPTGLEFTVTGPNGYTETAVTPWSWTQAPQGQYAVQFKVPAGCTPPKNQGQRLQAGERISFSITLDCDAADEMREGISRAGDQRVKQRAEETAAAMSSSIFQDVPKDAWFAPYIWRVNQHSLMAGYKNADGSLTGEFGPERAVSVAELIAIAQRAANRSVALDIVPANASARGQWFAGAYAAAETDGWFLTFDRDLNPARAATRAEVVSTLLQALDVPLEWPHGTLFADIHPSTPWAMAIETMAELGAISTDKVNDRLPNFRPNDQVNRAELGKMLILLLDQLESDAAKNGK